ncbi:MAG: hypothetical protein K2N73_08575 [Lachnospiraceae bacterium]|nr:hypothetical protein [Lachnospiraceae bacterium]
MINSIIESVSTSLSAEFGDGFTIYTELLEQGFDRPCFFVFCSSAANQLIHGNRYFRENRFCIRYVPSDKEQENKECNAAAERLYCCLEYITVSGKKVRGTKMKCEAADGVLNFYVNFDLFVYREKEPVPVMAEVSVATSMEAKD